jgi:hypothetical protein
MRTITILLSFLVFASLLQAQETSPDSLTRKEIRKKHKVEKQLLRQKQYEEMSDLLENRSFVLEADYIQNQYLNHASVSALINFVMVDSATMIGQLGFLGWTGSNGAGGGTGKGEIMTYKLSKHDKAKSFSLEMGVDMRGGRVNIFMDIDASGTAKADVVFTIYGHLIYDGRIVPLKDSKVFIGRYL